MVDRRTILLGGSGVALAAIGTAYFAVRKTGSMAEYTAAIASTRAELEQTPEMRDLIRHATLAANSHNTQPWRFAIKKDIETIAKGNANFRQVLYTAQHCQLVVMCLGPGEDIGMEVHKLDQFFRVEDGQGEAVLDDVHTPVRTGFAILVPAGTKHNIINTGKTALKLYTLYAPPNHRDGVTHQTRADASKDSEHFDGDVTERRPPVPASAIDNVVPI